MNKTMQNFKKQLKDAICNNDIDFLKSNENRFNVNDRFDDENNDTLLSYSISDNGSEIYKYFLDRNADLLLLNDEGENIIHSIVYSGCSERLNDILKRGNININFQSKDGTTPLLLSVVLERYDIFHQLIEIGAEINITDYEGNSPLHPACFLGYKEMVYSLVEKKANLFAKTKNGNLPLALAVNGGHDEIVKFLYNKIYGIPKG